MDSNGPLGLVPPVGFGDGFVRAGVASDDGHDGEVVFLDDLLHHLDYFQVSMHVSIEGPHPVINGLREMANLTEQIVFVSPMVLAILYASSTP